MVPVLLVVGLLALGANGKKGHFGDLPMQSSRLRGGDILERRWEDRNAIVLEHLKWPDGVIPYVIDDSISDDFKETILRGMDQYHKNTCIKFEPRTDEKDYIVIFRGEGCYSSLGRVYGRQVVSLDNGCEDLPTVVHELGHVVGFDHEHNRCDRDDYLTIHWENIKNDELQQFDICLPDETQLLGDFDYDSIMLYGETAFSKDGVSKTMEAKDPDVRLKDLVDKPGLSELDIIKIQKLYECDR